MYLNIFIIKFGGKCFLLIIMLKNYFKNQFLFISDFFPILIKIFLK
jgi:hypothetical protein